MTAMTMKITSPHPYDETIALVREQLATVGFGVLTEIDIRATLKAKLDVDVDPQIILGACRPQLAHAALEADPSIAAMLPCNVVVRVDGDQVVVEAFDPQSMIAMSTEAPQALRDVAADARQRLGAALDAVAGN